MQRPFKKEMHNPQNDSTKFVVGQRHGRTGKSSPAATKLQRETWSRVMTWKLFLQSSMVLGVFSVFFFSKNSVKNIIYELC